MYKHPTGIGDNPAINEKDNVHEMYGLFQEYS